MYLSIVNRSKPALPEPAGRKLCLRAFTLVVVVAALLAFHAPAAFGQSNVTGTWQTLPTLMPINPVHTALMSNGKILVVSGSGNYPQQTTFMVGVWDPSNNSATTTTQSWDMFCNGMVVLPDGRPFIMGGNLQYDPFHGWQRTTAYDPTTGKYTDMEDMAHGRWYPTSTVLGDGRVMTFSGLDENGGTNTQVEIYKVGVGWGAPVAASFTPPLYPRLTLLPSGKVLYSGSSAQSRTFDPSTNTWSGVIATTVYGSDRTYGSTVLLPLLPSSSYKPQVMIFGGGNPSTKTTELIDMSAASPKWVKGPDMSKPRIEMNATLLPTGKILMVGGSLNDEDVNSASLQADLYDPYVDAVQGVQGTMVAAGSECCARLYHSVSLLLPDATVWVAGGNPNRGSYEQHVEIYTPPYLYNSNGTLAARPSISSVSPTVIGYGTSFQVQTPDAANIASVVLMKNGATTHAFDMDQRMVGLVFSVNGNTLNLTGPPNGNIAPPGYYMLFLVNTAGVPSVAKFVQVSKTPTDVPPTGTITSPATDVTIAPGQSVSFAGTGTASSGSITGYSWSIRGGLPSKSSLANPGNVTFSTAGTYTAVFTVTDSAGNTDQSPETRIITVTSAPAPKLNSLSPTTGNQGASSLIVVLTGTNFLSSPTCSFGAGITVNSCTFNSSTKITASINIQSGATTGTRNVTVTNTDGQNSTLTNGFTVLAGSGNPAPTITSVSPNSATQGQSNLTVTINGTNFLTAPGCSFDSDAGGGLTFNSCTYNSATKITASVSIAANAVLGGHNITVTDTDGQSATSINGFVVSSAGGGAINFGSGFTAGSMVVNGSAAITVPSLTLTTTATTDQAGSAWFSTPVNIQNFTNDFTFQLTAGANTADGFAFVLQGNNTAALGLRGGELGYTGIGKSVAVKFDLYDNTGEGSDSTGIFLNGVSPYTPAVDLTSTGIDLHSGHVFQVHMTYDGTNLAMTITDGTTNATFTKTWAVNISSAVGGTTAYAGFTGGTGGLLAAQKILTWTMGSSGGGGGTVATPTFSIPGNTYLGTQTVSLSDATSGASIFYTLDGTQPGTAVGGSTQQYSSALTVSSTTTIKALATATGLTTSATASATYVIESQVATPTFTPVGGSYGSAQSVTISTTTGSANIYYTTNGTTPTSSSTLYTGAINVATSQTLKAIATKSGFFDSNVGTAAYVIGGSGGAINLASGFTAGSVVVNGSAAITAPSLTLTTTAAAGNQAGSAWFPTPVNIQTFTNDFTFQLTAGANTADGFTFTLQGNNTAALGANGGELAYTGIGKSVAVKFDLYDNAGEGSDSTGIFLNGVSPYTPAVDLTSTGIDLHSGHVFQVHMTYDGANLAMTITDGTTNATFTKTWAVNISGAVGGTTAYAGFTGGTGGLTAAQQILSWTMSGGGGGGGTVATPTFSIPGGTYLGTQTVSLSDATSGATIFYTLDGSQPGTAVGGSTQQYNNTALTVSSTTTIKALATASGLTTSGTASATYTIQSQVATPTFNPVGGSYASAQSVTLNSTTSGATFYYTTNGTTPTSSSTLYTGAINVATSQTLKAIATKSGFFDSNVGTAAYVIAGTVATPTFSLPGGTYLGTQTVSLSDATSGASIFYTLDGTQPGTAVGGSTQKYSSALTVSSTETIKALATATGMNTSATATATYTIQSQVATPTFTPVGGSYASAQSVTITSATSGATIYYTTNGTTPTSSSTLYTGAINVATSQTLKAIATKSGFFDSNVATAAYGIGGSQQINYASGFTGSNLSFHGAAKLNGTRLRLTDTTSGDGNSSAWFTTPVNVQKFTTDFTFQITTPNADGMTFTIQNAGLSAIGGIGGGLGYGADTPGGPLGIANSVAVKFDIYDNAGEGVNSTGLYTGGASPTTPATTFGGGINLHSGHIFSAHIVYDGTTLTMTVTDTQATTNTFTTSWTVNIPSTVGANTAYVGFTAGIGGSTSRQEVVTWTYTVN